MMKNRGNRLALAGILLLAVFLHLFRLGQEGYANLYYAAAVKSMPTSWHNLFFASFDPAGFVAVDKPPLGLWVQAASAALFGFHGLSLLLPQAVAGILSVALLYHLVRRVFGPPAGLLAALVLTLTPISIAANRNNTMDSQLVFVLLLAAWAISLAAEKGRLRWLLLGFVLVGIGFNIKMLQAFMVLPAFYFLYVATAPVRWWKRLLHPLLATVVLLVVSLAWALTVDLTPPEQRPYVGSSEDNTVLELVIGHNGMKRLLPGGPRGMLGGQQPPPGGQQPLPGGQQPLPGGQQPPPGGQQPPPGGQQPPPGGAPYGPGRGPGQETGDPGPLRLFNQQLGGQASWLLPLALLGFFVAAWQIRLRWPLDRRHQALLLWLGWLLPQAVFFSVANLFHRYYLEMLSPAIAALVGAGAAALWNDYRGPQRRGWLLPAALVGSAAVEVALLSAFPDWSRWLSPLVAGLCLAAAATLVVARLFSQARTTRPVWAGVAATVAVLALLLPPTVWTLIPVWSGGDTALPYAGPDLLAQPRRGGLPETDQLVAYLTANRGDETFLAAAINANTAAPLMLETGEAVMALGGFSGSDPILTADELAERVAGGAVRFFLIPPDGGQQRELTRWVTENCRPVAPELWRPGGPGVGGEPGGLPALFDCGR